MDLLLIFGIWMLNLGISIWNNWVTGQVWVEAKHAGGWYRFMAWMGYLMTSIGYSWNLLIVVALVCFSKGWLDLEHTQALLYIGYIILVPGVLFSGYAIMFNSWANAYRTRTVSSFSIAAYNTYANIHNTYNAVKTMPQAFKAVGKTFTGGRGKDKANALVLLLAIACLLAGFIIAGIVVWRIAANDEPLPERT
ncbi:MAG: hypothetical protein WC659_06905 [Patescibacteria group bacterium]